MRITISLDAELEPVIRALSREQNNSISAAINQLVRRGLEPRPYFPPMTGEDELPVTRGRRIFTSDDVYQMEKDIP